MLMRAITMAPLFFCDTCHAYWIDLKAPGLRYRHSMCETCVHPAFADNPFWEKLTEEQIVVDILVSGKFIKIGTSKQGAIYNRPDALELRLEHSLRVRELYRTSTARETVTRHVNHLTARLEFEVGHRAVLNEHFKRVDESDKELIRLWMEASRKHSKELQRQIAKIELTMQLACVRTGSKTAEKLKRGMPFTTIDLERVKDEIPVEVILGKPERTFGTRLSYKCPFHGEKTASFVFFNVSGNRHFHCYGCQVHGSIVDLMMKVNSLTFADAVQSLIKLL